MLKELTNQAKLGENDIEYAKYHDYFETEDGLVVAFNKRNPKIQSTLWFADEDPNTGEYVSPSDIANTKEQIHDLFIKENLHNIVGFTNWLEKHPTGEIWISKSAQYIGDSKARYIANVFPADLYDLDEKSRWERKLTDSELKQLLDYEKTQKEQFIKRLERYWKRYSDKVRIDTYWANR